MKHIRHGLWSTVVAVSLAGCGDMNKSDGKSGANDLAPADSTGAQGKLFLQFGRGLGSTLRLEAETDTTTSEDTSTETTTDSATSTDGAMSTDSEAGTRTDTDTSSETGTEVATTLKISDSIELTEARFNIAAIKLKPTKERSPQEDEKEAEISAKEKAAAAQLDLIEDEGASSVATDESTSQDNPAGQDTPDDTDQDDDDSVADDQADDHEGADHGGGHHGGHHGGKDHEHGHHGHKGGLLAKLLVFKAKLLELLVELKTGEFERIEHEANSDRAIYWKGPYLYDAISGKVTGDLPAAELADGSYRRLEFKLRRNYDELEGAVFVIKGNFTRDDEVTPFEITWRCAMNLRLRSDNPYQVVAGGDNKLAIVFDLPQWFEGIDLAAAEVDNDGVIRINRHSNRGLVHALRHNLKTSLKFGKDANADGKLEANETTGVGEDTQDPVGSN